MSTPDTKASGPAPRRLRAALLGAVAVVALGGVATQTTLLPTFSAQAAQIDAQPAPSHIAPGSFADVVDRVTPAVVSVKVKVTENEGDQASSDDNSTPNLPNIPKDDPLYRFFKQFGQGGGAPHASIMRSTGSAALAASSSAK